MGKENLTFGDTEIEKKKKTFYHHASPVFLEDIGNEKVLASNKISSGQKKEKKKTKKTMNALLVTCVMFIKLSHYI